MLANSNYREDGDGVNPLDDYANEVYEPSRFGYKGVGAWSQKPMVRRVFPKGNVYNETVDFTCNARYAGGCDLLPVCTRASYDGSCVLDRCSKQPCLPTLIADEFYIELTGFSDVLLDYYISATDANVGWQLQRIARACIAGNVTWVSCRET